MYNVSMNVERQVWDWRGDFEGRKSRSLDIENAGTC